MKGERVIDENVCRPNSSMDILEDLSHRSLIARVAPETSGFNSF
jgi:hypothetical protein